MMSVISECLKNFIDGKRNIELFAIKFKTKRKLNIMAGNINAGDKCRTCLKGSKGFQLLSKLITENQEETKSFADFLKDITQIDIMNEEYRGMPQSICVSCVRKLKASYAFVQQAQQVHNKLRYMFNGANIKANCLQEEQIDVNACLEIKVEEDDTDDLKSGFAGISSTQNESTNCLIKRNIEHKFDLHDGTELSENKLNSEFDENDHKPDAFTDTDNDAESKSSTNSDWVQAAVQIKKESIDDDIPTACDQCDRVFPNARLLRRHRSRKHVPDLKTQCPFCPAKYARRYYMYAHMRTNHKDKPIEEHISTLPRQYACDQCDANYTSEYFLLAHKKEKHNPDSAPKISKRVVLPKKRFLCTLCGSKFETLSNLNVHIRRHTGERPFKCDLCDRSFYRPCDVQVHRRSHTGEKPFICQICDKAFAKTSKLKVHIRTHSNERPYKCTQCEKAFKQSKDLTIHRRIHTGERPYVCGVCHSTFTQSNSLKLHQTKQQHFAVPEKPAPLPHEVNFKQ